MRSLPPTGDPAQFPDPDRLDLGRATSGHVAFGYDLHYCAGVTGTPSTWDGDSTILAKAPARPPQWLQVPGATGTSLADAMSAAVLVNYPAEGCAWVVRFCRPYPIRSGTMRHSVPWITQYASPSLIAAMAYGGHPRVEDPRWRESGAPDLETYGAWCGRWCGMACFRMALLARDGAAPTLYELAMGCVEYGAYTDEPGRPEGLIYRPFAEYARERHGLQADVITGLDPARLTAELDAGRLVIASVHPEIRRPREDPPGTGGHLVLVTGHAGGQVTFHNPSGHTPEAVVATLPMPVFDRFAAHRGIALHL